MGRILAEDVAAVRTQTPLDVVVGGSIVLRPAGGAKLKGLCPFHNERTPSLHVDLEKGFWYCFGCSQGGDAIDFVRRVDGLTFVEAVEKLADISGVTLRYEDGGVDPSEYARRKRLHRLLAEAHQVAVEHFGALPANHAARQLLTGRGFGDAVVEHFETGYAPARGGLSAVLSERGWAGQDLEDAGLTIVRGGQPRDLFAGRLLWPIRDPAGRVVGFGGRLLPGGGGPKYVNSPETVLYRKSEVLFNLHEARKKVDQGTPIVVVEGYTDVMAMHADGVPTAVATCGTSFGDAHVDLLRRTVGVSDGAPRVVFVFDGDNAGQSAAGKVFTFDTQFTRRAFIAVPPGGADPCDFLASEGGGSLRALVEGAAIPVAEYALTQVLAGRDLDTVEGRAAALDAAVPVLAAIRDDMLRASYDRWVSARLGVEAWRIAGQVRGYLSKPEPERGGEAGAKTVEEQIPPVEREALKCVLQYPAESAEWWEAVELSAFTSDAAVDVCRAVGAAGGCDQAGGREWLERVAEKSRRSRLVGALVVEPLRFAGPDSEVGQHCEASLRLLIDADARRRIAHLRATISRMDTRAPGFAEMFAEILALEGHRREL